MKQYIRTLSIRLKFSYILLSAQNQQLPDRYVLSSSLRFDWDALYRVWVVVYIRKRWIDKCYSNDLILGRLRLKIWLEEVKFVRSHLNCALRRFGTTAPEV